MSRLWAVLVGVLATLTMAGVAPTTIASAAPFAYDEPALARVDAQPSKPAEASPTQLSGSREASASRPVEARSTTTTPVRSVVATEAAGGAGDHIVLGLRDAGLEETAAKVGGRTLLSDPQWQSSLQQAIGEPGTRFTVALDGLSGSTPYSQVMSAVQNGVTPLATPTNWELAQLYQAGRIGDVTFVSGGQVVPNPWGG